MGAQPKSTSHSSSSAIRSAPGAPSRRCARIPGARRFGRATIVSRGADMTDVQSSRSSGPPRSLQVPAVGLRVVVGVVAALGTAGPAALARSRASPIFPRCLLSTLGAEWRSASRRCTLRSSDAVVELDGDHQHCCLRRAGLFLPNASFALGQGSSERDRSRHHWHSSHRDHRSRGGWLGSDRRSSRPHCCASTETSRFPSCGPRDTRAGR